MRRSLSLSDEPLTGERSAVTTIQRRAAAPTVLSTDAGPGGDDDGLAAGHRYERRETLGAGGMGEVRLCFDRRIGRSVAMKVVLHDHADRRDLQTRFLREARVQGQLEHPSIVPVYDLGTDASGTTYFTMKRVHGVTLATIIDRLDAKEPEARARYTRHKLLTAFGNICLAVDYAHAHGVLHRDLKPANVMLGDFGEVYVLDWGLAKLEPLDEADVPAVSTEDADVGRTRGSARGAVVGTPGYMAPEQVVGDGERIDARADVYSLGAVLFEILALRPLHRGDSVPAMHASTLTGADPRAVLAATELDVAPELAAICAKATALDPRARYASTRELHDAVERFLEGDRDVSRRRETARLHALAAADHATAAERDDGAAAALARSRALGDVSRALALDPGNVDAMQTFVTLLTQPPATLPAEVEQELLASWRAGHGSRVRAGAIPCAIFGGLVLLASLAGVANVVATSTCVALWALAALSCLFSARRPRADGKVQLPMLGAIMAAITATSAAFGPFLLVPAMSVFTVMAFLTNRDASRRWIVVAAGCAAILAPLALEWTGLVPASYVLAHGTLSIVPRMLALSGGTIWALALGNVAVVVLSAHVMARFGDLLGAAERRLVLQSWQLRQLVPARAKP